jgi:hypothetical protein
LIGRATGPIALLAVAGCGGFVGLYSDDGGSPDLAGSGGVTVLAGNRAASADLVVGGGFVYWVDEGTSSHNGDGKVMRVPADGCGGQSPSSCPTVLADMRNAPTAITLSLDGTTLLWTELQDATGSLTDGGVFSLDLTMIAGNMIGKPVQLAMQQDGPIKIAVDGTALYWINGNSGEVRRMWLDGGTPNGLVIAQPAAPSGLAVDAAVQRVHVTTSGSNGGDGLLVAFDFDGKNAATLASSLHDPRGVALGPTYVYWVNTTDGTVLHARRDGSDFGPSASSRATPRAVALDADRLYWVEAGTAPYYLDGRVASCKLDGSDLQVLADHRSYPRNLALDDKYVYWVDRGTAGGDMYDGAVLRVEKPPAQ